MELSIADRRLGAVHEDVPVQGAGTGDPSVADDRLHAVRSADSDADRTAAAAPLSTWIDPVTGKLWGSAPDWMHRKVRERQYCEHVRDAKAAGHTPKTPSEWFTR